jgi:uncharacterized alkaline shock family protein YloU
MKVLHRLVVLVVFALVLFLGVLGLVAALSDAWWAASLAFAGGADGRLYAGCASLGLLSLGLLMGLTGGRRKQRERILALRTENGVVSLTLGAIAEYIGKLAPEFPSVVRMTPTVVPRRGTIDVGMEVSVRGGPQIHEVCEVLQRRVRETLVNGLGIQDVGRVEVRVRDISPEHKDA